MSLEIETVGDIATGALLARAVESEQGEGAGTASTNCLNCTAPLTGAFCINCGQKAKVHRTLTAFWHDLIHGVFHFDGKIWRTLPMLVWKPGELTRRYINGERARFVSPLALFLFMIFAMFAVFSATAGHLDDLASNKPKFVEQGAAELKKGMAEAKAKERDLTAQRATLAATSEDTTDVDSDLADVRDAIAGMTEAQKAIAQFGAGKAIEEDSGVVFKDVHTGVAKIDEGIAKAQKNPALFLYKLQNAAYKYSWALIPLSLPFIWLMFAWRRQFRLYDHAVFITYSLCFMAMLAMVAALIGKYTSAEDSLVALLMLVPPVHMFRQLRGTYHLGTVNALMRTSYLVLASIFALTIFMLLLILLGVVG